MAELKAAGSDAHWPQKTETGQRRMTDRKRLMPRADVERQEQANFSRGWIEMEFRTAYIDSLLIKF